MKLFLTLASMGVVHWGIMDSGDPHGFYGSLFVFFAMMALDYNNPYAFYLPKYRKTMTGIIGALTLICLFGVFKIFSVKQYEGIYYMAIHETMYNGGIKLFSINSIFFVLYGLMLIISTLESLVNVKTIDLKEVNQQ